MTREQCKKAIQVLVQKYTPNAAEYTNSGSTYNETQARTDFITPFLEALGWDVRNTNQYPEDQRDVIEEATVEVGPEKLSKKPDYELRVARQRKIFVEAKRPSKTIQTDKDSAFQARRYGFSASMPITVLTNFEYLAIYDSVPPPSSTDDSAFCRTSLIHYTEFNSRFDEIYDLLSRETVHTGAFDKRFKVRPAYRGTNQFDDLFLEQVRSWRIRLAEDIAARNASVDNSLLTFATQRFLTRLIFLRICEDRDIEKYESLKNLTGAGVYAALKGHLAVADKIYNSGLFQSDGDPSLALDVGDGVLGDIITELYYPKSPYTFSVVEPTILGEVYELLLGEAVELRPGGKVETVLKPEVKASGGVYATPQFVVDKIVDKALRDRLTSLNPKTLENFTVADISCGSGIFLIAAYQALLDHYREHYVKAGPLKFAGTTLYDAGNSRWELTLEERRRILLLHIYGVDIDDQAVEVARFSVLLKLIEKETSDSVKSYVKRHQAPVLPVLDGNIQHGNSLVTSRTLKATYPRKATGLIPKVIPLDWESAFPQVTRAGGFSTIIGNPPYIRIQNMVGYSPEEIEIYRHESAAYTTAKADNFDKYALFTERALGLLKPGGMIGFIIPNKFFTIKFGARLRDLLTKGQHIRELVHFGAQQIFGTKASNYTCILVATRGASRNLLLERVTDLSTWRYGTPGDRHEIPSSDLNSAPWRFASDEAAAVFDQVRRAHPTALKSVAEIFVGAQTSADKIYAVTPLKQTRTHVAFKDLNGAARIVEKGIVRPFLLDVQIIPFGTPRPNTLLIWPYRQRDGHMQVMSEAELANDFPLAWKYLKDFKDPLSERSILGGAKAERKWYQFGRAQSLDKFDSPKLIAQVLSLEPRYAYDPANIVVTGGGNGPYYLIRPRLESPYSIFYLLAVLSHPLSEAIIRSRPTIFRGGYYSHSKQFLAGLPVPTHDIGNPASVAIHDAVVRDVEQLIVLTDSLREPISPAGQAVIGKQIYMMRSKVEAQLNDLFGLTPKQLDIILSVPVPE